MSVTLMRTKDDKSFRQLEDLRKALMTFQDLGRPAPKLYNKLVNSAPATFFYFLFNYILFTFFYLYPFLYRFLYFYIVVYIFGSKCPVFITFQLMLKLYSTLTHTRRILFYIYLLMLIIIP